MATLPAPLAQWAKDAGEAFSAFEAAESMLATVGIQLRTHFESVEDMKAQNLYDPLRDAFKAAYIATGKKEANVPSNWASILYQYAWPGTGAVRGRYYKLDEETGVSVLDKDRNQPTPPSSASPAPKYLRGMPFISPEDVVELGGFPMRLIVAAGSGGGKTTYVRRLLEALLPRLDFVLVVTGTLKEHWAGLPGKVEVLEFDDDPEMARVQEVIERQKQMVRDKERVGSPLFLFDDIGDRGGAKRGKVGELLDSMYMTLRNFGISVIAISQQQNNFLTPARRDGATVILVGDLTNPQREQIYDTLSVPPTQLAKKDFVTWCHETLGRAHNYTFLAYLKEQKKRQLFLTGIGAGGPVEDLGKRMEALSMEGGGAAAYAQVDPHEAPEEAPAAAGGGGARWGVFKQGGVHQGTQQDLYTTYPRTVEPLLAVLKARLKKGSLIWEPCLGLGNIAEVLAAAGHEVVGSDLYTANEGGGFTMNTDKSFVECEVDGQSIAECAVPEGVTHIVTNPPFSEKLAFVQRFYRLGLPTYCLLPLDTLGHKGCSTLFEAHGVEIFFLSGKAAKTFYKVSEARDVDMNVCAWFGFNTRVAGEENYHHFL